MRLAVLLVPFALLAADKPRPEILHERQQRYPQWYSLEERARGVPPEFAAATLLRLSRAVPDRNWKRELIEEAFAQAQRVSLPLQSQFIGAVVIPSRAIMLDSAHGLRLNRLSLATDAVRAMAALYPPRAVAMFNEIAPPHSKRLSCSDALWEDPADYYAALPVLYKGGMDDDRFRDFYARFSALSSAAEIAPAANAVGMVQLTAAQREMALAALTGALQRITSDDRTFTATLAAAYKAVSPFAGPALTAAFRDYAKRHLAANRCAADERIDAAVATALNALNRDLSRFNLPQLAPEELRPSRREGAPELHPLYPKGQERPHLSRFNALMYREGRALPLDEKNTAVWKQKYAEYVAQIETFERDSTVSDAIRFYRLSEHFTTALIAAPAGESRDRALEQYLVFLRSSPMQQESLLEWFSSVVRLADIIKTLHGAEHKKFLQAVSSTGHPVLVLYAQAEQVLGAQ